MQQHTFIHTAIGFVLWCGGACEAVQAALSCNIRHKS